MTIEDNNLLQEVQQMHQEAKKKPKRKYTKKVEKQKPTIKQKIKNGTYVSLSLLLVLFGLMYLTDWYFDRYDWNFRTPIIVQSPLIITKLNEELLVLEESYTKVEEINEVEIPQKEPEKIGLEFNGMASWYGTGEGECLGCKPYYDQNGWVYYLMNNGQMLDDSRLTVAFNRLPLGSKVEVLNYESGKSVVAEVTDTGGFEDLSNPKIIDLTKAVRDSIQCGDVCPVLVKEVI